MHIENKKILLEDKESVKEFNRFSDKVVFSVDIFTFHWYKGGIDRIVYKFKSPPVL